MAELPAAVANTPTPLALTASTVRSDHQPTDAFSNRRHFFPSRGKHHESIPPAPPRPCCLCLSQINSPATYCADRHTLDRLFFTTRIKKSQREQKNTRAYSTMVARSQRAHHIALSRAKCDSIGAFCRPGPRPRKNAAEGGPTAEHTFENKEEASRLAASFSC